MFETQVADLLQRAAGEYIRGIDKTALKISVLSGDVILRRLQLKPEAFERLNLPIDLTRGVVGSLRVKIPWAKLGKEPVVVTISEVFASARRLSAEEVAKRAKERREEHKKEDEAAVEKEGEEDEDGKKRNDEKVERLDNAERLWLVKRLFDPTHRE